MGLTTRQRVNRILEYYFSGPLPADLEEDILLWILGEGHEEDKEAKLEELWGKIVKYDRHPVNEKELVESINAVKRHLGLPPMEMPRTNTVKRRQPLGRRILTYAAVAAIPVMLLIGGVYLLTKEKPAAVPGVEFAEMRKAAGDKEEFLLLPDGSQVWLKPGAVITYPEDFENGRAVALEGTAYFKVEKADGQKFVVNTRALDVTVLGTEFSVRANLHEDETEIVLNTGKLRVRIEDSQAEYMLADRQRLLYRHLENEAAESDLAPGESPDIRSFSFEREPLGNILDMLAERYGINIRYAPRAIAGERVTIKLRGEEPLDSLLLWLRDITGAFDYAVEDGEVEIK